MPIILSVEFDLLRKKFTLVSKSTLREGIKLRLALQLVFIQLMLNFS